MDDLFKPGVSVYCLGIGGIGLSAAAQWLKELGVNVSGSDNNESVVLEMLREKGINAVADANVSTLPEGINLLIYSDAVSEEHSVRKYAKEKGIDQINYAKALGILTKNYKIIAVAGSHGKSSTTALIGHVLTELGADPTVVVGTKVPTLGNVNFRFGKSDIAVLEADEYRSHFLEIEPMVCIINNVDHDHVDVFPTEELYVDAYRKLVGKIKSGGELILRASDRFTPVLAKLRTDIAVKFFDIGDDNVFSSESEKTYFVGNTRFEAGKQKFDIVINKNNIGEFEIAFPGDHMALNTAAAFAAIERYVVDVREVKKALGSFRGTWRRFERVGLFNENIVISDYAHHPTEVRALLLGARQAYPDKKIKIVFQPHQGSRTKAFGSKFVSALSLADEILLVEVFGVAGREDDNSKKVTDRHWIEDLKRMGKNTLFAEDLIEAERVVRSDTKDNEVILFVGAGSIDQLARKIVL